MPLPPKKAYESAKRRTPHPAKVAQPKKPHGASVGPLERRPPHPATLQRKAPLSPHAATLPRAGVTLPFEVRAPWRTGKHLQARLLRPLRAPRRGVAEASFVPGSRAVQRSSEDGEKEIGSLFDDLDLSPSISVAPTVIDCNGLAEKVVDSGHAPMVFAFDTGLNGGTVQLGNTNGPLPRGVIHLTASSKSGVVSINCVEQASSTSFRAFWLPWDVSKVNFVSWDELDSSGVGCFMTVPLSGCAVVVAETGILHVTEGAYKQTTLNTVLRLESDGKTIGATTFPLAHTWGLTDWPEGYSKRGLACRGLVFGFKIQGVWYFYFLARVDSEGRYSWESGVRAE